MVIPHKILNLDYDPAKDVLFVEWPNFEHYALPELNYSLNSLVEVIRSYDIKNLLIDARATVVAIDTVAYEEISGKFALDLLSTRLKKLARLVTDNSVREKQVQNFKEKSQFTFELESFKNQDEAIGWLDN